MSPERLAEFRAHLSSGTVELPAKAALMVAELLEKVEQLQRDLDATKRAKAENDERFMIERDEARAELTRLTPTWRDGEPPQNGAYVWREHPQGATIVEVLSAEDRADYDGEGVCFWDAVDGAVPWGSARWCPIEVPK